MRAIKAEEACVPAREREAREGESGGIGREIDGWVRGRGMRESGGGGCGERPAGHGAVAFAATQVANVSVQRWHT